VICQLLSRRQGMLIILLIAVLGIFAWSPWLTETYAISAVTENLGGPDQDYDYLGNTIPIRDVPKNSVRVPFAYLVYFPGEAMYIVTFWGWVL
jgi:hypothetical protein